MTLWCMLFPPHEGEERFYMAEGECRRVCYPAFSSARVVQVVSLVGLRALQSTLEMRAVRASKTILESGEHLIGTPSTFG